MSSAARGNLGEAAVLAALIQQGFDVLVPFGGGQAYDLVLDLGDGSFLRVQCKTGWQVSGCIAFNSRSTDHGKGRQSYEGLADLFGIYFPVLNSVYLVPVAAVPGVQGRLRLEPTRNNQRRGVRFAADFAIASWHPNRFRCLVGGFDEKIAMSMN